jgi:hypothetical protein
MVNVYIGGVFDQACSSVVYINVEGTATDNLVLDDEAAASSAITVFGTITINPAGRSADLNSVIIDGKTNTTLSADMILVDGTTPITVRKALISASTSWIAGGDVILSPSSGASTITIQSGQIEFGGSVNTNGSPVSLVLDSGSDVNLFGAIGSANPPDNVVIRSGLHLPLNQNITVAANGILELNSLNGVTQSGGSVSASNLLLRGAGSFDLSGGANNSVGTLAANVTALAGASDKIAFTRSAGSGLTIGSIVSLLDATEVAGVTGNGDGATPSVGPQISIITNAGDLTVNQPVATVLNNISLKAGGTLTSSSLGDITTNSPGPGPANLLSLDANRLDLSGPAISNPYGIVELKRTGAGLTNIGGASPFVTQVMIDRIVADFLRLSAPGEMDFNTKITIDPGKIGASFLVQSGNDIVDAAGVGVDAIKATSLAMIAVGNIVHSNGAPQPFRVDVLNLAVNETGNQNVYIKNAGALTLLGVDTLSSTAVGGLLSLNAPSVICQTSLVAHDLVVNASGGFTAPASTLSLEGDLTLAAGTAFNHNNGAVQLGGTARQTITAPDATPISPLAFYSLQVSNPAGVQLSADIQVDNSLSMAGLLYVRSKSLTLKPAAVISNPTAGPASMIVLDDGPNFGTIYQQLNAAKTFLLPVGDTREGPFYSPASLSFSGGTYSGAVSLKLTHDPHPQILGSPFNRYWTISADATILPTSVVANFTYDPRDVTTESLYLTPQLYVGPTSTDWAPPDWPDANQSTYTFSMTFPAPVHNWSEWRGDYTLGSQNSPTAILVEDVSTAVVSGGVKLTWQAPLPAQVTGFNVYRATSLGGGKVKLNGALIVGNGTDDQFFFTDATAKSGLRYYYWVEAVTSTTTQMSQPILGGGVWLYLPAIVR